MEEEQRKGRILSCIQSSDLAQEECSDFGGCVLKNTSFLSRVYCSKVCNIGWHSYKETYIAVTSL